MDDRSDGEIKEDIIYEYPYLQHYPIIFISIKENFRIEEVLKNVLDVFFEDVFWMLWG